MLGGAISALATMPVWAVVLLVLVLLALLVALLWGLRRRATEPDRPAKAQRRERKARDPTGMWRACRQFHARLGQAFPGTRSRYRLPLFIAVGPSREAIADAVRGCGMSQPLGDSLRSGGLTWTAFDKAAVVEVDPGVILDERGRGDRWRAFIRLLQRFRPQRPADGVLLVLPAQHLEGSDTADEAHIREAEQIRERLADLENQLCMSLPIHCVVAHAEAVPGFAALGEALPAYQLNRPLGYASPYGAREAYRSELVDDAVASLRGRVQRLVLEALAVDRGSVDADALFRLPAALDRLRPGLRSYLDTVMQPGQYARLTSLRGIYIGGEVAVGPGQRERTGAFVRAALVERIFPEYSLAEPTGSHWIAANRDVRRGQVGVAALLVLAAAGLYAQDRILANRVPQMRSLVSAVGKDYRRVSIARAEGGTAADLFRQETAQFIQRMSGLDGDFLWSVFVPSSWFGQLPRDIERLQTGAYIEIFFKGLSRSLQNRAEAVASDRGGTRGYAGGGDGDAPYPNYEPLRRQLSRYARLATQIEHYRQLGAGQRDAFALRELSSYLYDVDLPAGFFPEIDPDALGARGFVLETVKPAHYRDQARSSFLERFGQFTFDLTTRDELAARLRTIRDILGSRDRLFEIQRGSLTRMRQLYANLKRLEQIFDTGQYNWVLKQEHVIGSGFETLLTRVAKNRLLGERVAGRLRQQGLRTRRQFRQKLTGMAAPGFGEIVVVTSDGLRLSKAARGVLARLESFERVAAVDVSNVEVSQGERGTGQGRRMPLPVPRSQYIMWNTEALAAGARVLDDIATRVEGGSTSRTVERALSNVVRAEKLDAIVTAVDRAVRERNRQPKMDSDGGSEMTLRSRARNFAEASRYLNRFLQTLTELRASQLRRNLLHLVGWEAEKILVAATEILKANDLYTVDRNAIRNWQGGRGLALSAFGVESRSGLVAYLARQRARMRTLAEDYAQPAMRFLYGHARDYNPERLEAFARWRIVLEDLQRYRNKTPGNPVQRLENYVLNTMQRVTVADCSQARGATEIAGDSYVEKRLKTLAVQTHERCVRLKTQQVRRSYAELARRFNANLAGQAPFVATARMHEASPVAPQALVRFVERFDQDMNQGIGDPRYWADAAKGEAIVTFLDALDRAVAALRPAIGAGKSERAALSYGVQPEFRVRRDDERGASHVLSWDLTIADRRRTLFNGDKTVRWRPGETVSMAFTWAKDAPSMPDGASDMPGFSVSNGTARVSFDGTWSLLSLLAHYGGDDVAGGGHTLRFDLPVAHKTDDAEGAPLKGDRARLFVRLHLRAGGQRVTLPAFPTRAPLPQISTRAAARGEDE